MKGFFWAGLFALTIFPARGAEEGDKAIVIYNTRVPDSKAVAEYYAEKRHVPPQQIFGFDLPEADDVSRAEFRNSLQRPLAKALQEKKLWRVGGVMIPGTNKEPAHLEWKVTESKIRYAVLCYGMPLRITHDPALREEGLDKLKPETRRNGAALESDLAFLPLLEQNLPISGPLRNPVFGHTNAASLDPTNGVLLVSRLDGPTAGVARGLVDKSIEAETDGLWGRAYFDVRNITDPGFKMGDDWIRSAREICRKLGFETTLDENAGTFQAGFPMSHIAFYLGWYTETASGPFAQPTVEFMPGAFAYHIHSFSAVTIHSTTRGWVGPLLAKGATCTMGNVDEPYLAGTPDVAVFVAGFIFQGFSFGEAAYASQSVLSWQGAVVGDPLYRPFAKNLAVLHEELRKRNNPKLEWSYLRLLDLNEANGKKLPELITLLEELDLTKKSAVLTEKLGDLYWAVGKPASATHTWMQALKLDPSPQQRLELLLTLGEKLTSQGEAKEAYDSYKEILKDFPEYPDKLGLDKKLLPLAQKLNHKGEVERLEAEIKTLSP